MLHIYLFSYVGNDGPKIVLLHLLRIVLLPIEAFTYFRCLSIFQIAFRLKGLSHHFAYGCICICSICSRAFGLLHWNKLYLSIYLCTQTAGDTSFLDFKKTNWRHCIAELTFIFGEYNTASDNIRTFPRVPVSDAYTGGKNNNMVYLCTGFTMMPLHRNDGMEPKRRLAYADFYQMQIVAKKIWVGGKTGGSVGFSETRHFFFFFFALKFKLQRFIFLLLYFSFKGIVLRIIMQKSACKNSS